MKILIVEDLQLKIDELTKFLEDLIPSVEISVKKSYHSGLEEIVVNHKRYDLILLDMSMQNYDISHSEAGGDPVNLAGLHILDQMYYREIDNKVIVVTMYGNFGEGSVSLQELNMRLESDYPDNYLGYVFFSTSDDIWEANLKKIIKKNFVI